MLSDSRVSVPTRWSFSRKSRSTSLCGVPQSTKPAKITRERERRRQQGLQRWRAPSTFAWASASLRKRITDHRRAWCATSDTPAPSYGGMRNRPTATWVQTREIAGSGCASLRRPNLRRTAIRLLASRGVERELAGPSAWAIVEEADQIIAALGVDERYGRMGMRRPTGGCRHATGSGCAAQATESSSDSGRSSVSRCIGRKSWSFSRPAVAFDSTMWASSPPESRLRRLRRVVAPTRPSRNRHRSSRATGPCRYVARHLRG